MAKRRSSRLIIAALIAGVVLLVLAGLGLLGAYFLLLRDPGENEAWVNPVTVISSDAIAPDVAVLTLAGEADDRVIRASVDVGEFETAYATLAFSTLLPDTTRSGHWLLLAAHYEDMDQDRARICYQAALDQVALAPTLADSARADVAVQVARGLHRLGRSENARLALRQAENIARSSASLLPAQRRTALAQVAEAYRALGDADEASRIRSELGVQAVESAVMPEPPTPLLPTLRGRVTLPPDVTAAIATRQDAAAVLAARWLSSGSTARRSLAQELGQALLAEDAARSDFYATADDLALADRLALLHDQVSWLTVKVRVARGAYGLSLAPDWEGQAEELEIALATANTDLINGYGRQLDTLDAAEAEPARVELLRQGLMWVRLGLFPGSAEETLSEQLTQASRQLWTRQGGRGLLILAYEERGQRFYVLSGSGTFQAAGGQ